MKTDKTRIDWTRPIEHIFASRGIEVEYFGPQTMGRDGRPIDDEYRHLVLTGSPGKDKFPSYVDDYGYIRAKAKPGGQMLIKNKAVPKPLPPPVVVVAAPAPMPAPVPVVATTTRVETPMKTAVDFGLVIAEMRHVRESMSAVVERLEALTTATFDANTLLVDEIRKALARPVAVAAVPTPEPKVETPTEPKKITLEMLAAAALKIQNKDKIDSRVAKRRLEAVAVDKSIEKVVVGVQRKRVAGVNYVEGYIEPKGWDGNAFAALVYERDCTHDVLFYGKDKHRLANVLTMAGVSQ